MKRSSLSAAPYKLPHRPIGERHSSLRLATALTFFVSLLNTNDYAIAHHLTQENLQELQSVDAADVEAAIFKRMTKKTLLRRIRFYAVDPADPDLIRGLIFKSFGPVMQIPHLDGELDLPWSWPVGRYIVPFKKMPYVVHVVPDAKCSTITLTYSRRKKEISDYFCS